MLVQPPDVKTRDRSDAAGSHLIPRFAGRAGFTPPRTNGGLKPALRRNRTMSVLVDENTKLICQGPTGSRGTCQSEQAIACGTDMVGGAARGQARARKIVSDENG